MKIVSHELSQLEEQNKTSEHSEELRTETTDSADMGE